MRARDLFLIPGALVCAAAGLWWGGRWTWVAARNRAPLEMTCAEFYEEPPSREWVRLSGCVADTAHIGSEWVTPRVGDKPAMYNEVTDIYVPMRPAGALRSVPAKILVRADSGQERNVVHDEALVGLIELKMQRSERGRQELRDLHLGLDEDFAIVDYREKPTGLPQSLGALVVGLGSAGYLGWRWTRRRRTKKVELARATVVR